MPISQLDLRRLFGFHVLDWYAGEMLMLGSRYCKERTRIATGWVLYSSLVIIGLSTPTFADDQDHLRSQIEERGKAITNVVADFDMTSTRSNDAEADAEVKTQAAKMGLQLQADVGEAKYRGVFCFLRGMAIYSKEMSPDMLASVRA